MLLGAFFALLAVGIVWLTYCGCKYIDRIPASRDKFKVAASTRGQNMERGVAEKTADHIDQGVQSHHFKIPKKRYDAENRFNDYLDEDYIISNYNVSNKFIGEERQQPVPLQGFSRDRTLSTGAITDEQKDSVELNMRSRHGPSRTPHSSDARAREFSRDADPTTPSESSRFKGQALC